MGRYILGLNTGHNSSACIGDKNGIIYAIQEERLNGKKNYWGFPRLSIDACLKYVNASPKDILNISHGGKQILCRYHSRDDILDTYEREDNLFGLLRQQIVVPFIIAVSPRYGQKGLQKSLVKAGLGDVPINYYDHHLTHAATAYYGLHSYPGEKYIILTCDGAGDNLCATVRLMGGAEEEMIASTNAVHSIGALYSWFTYLLGFMPLEDEYKIMGMAPYVSRKDTTRLVDIFRSYIWLAHDGLKFKRKTVSVTSNLSKKIFVRMKRERFDHISAAIQYFLEDILCAWASNAVKATGINKILAGGGVFMNVKANQVIARLPSVASFEAFPSCGDESLSIGAYYLEASRRFGHGSVKPLKNLYLGSAPDKDIDVISELKKSGFIYEKPDNIAAAVVELLISGHPVARCSGRMEFGARALGNRSIIADPKNQDVVRIINRMIKKRDFWMPFAPVIAEEKQHKYLDNPKNLKSPYMMMTFDTKDNFRDLIAAVHNADLTSRTQILKKEQNPELYEILKLFEERTARDALLNTSFNIHGYPMVCTAGNALTAFRDSGLKYLQLGDLLVRKA